jgi:hypothetical protein
MSEESIEELQKRLERENEEYARLKKSHRELDLKLQQLEEKRYLTPEEEMEVKKMKKEKLRLKDHMTEMLRAYQKKGATEINNSYRKDN